MELLAVDWHPAWISYEWWRDIGVPGLTGAGSVLVGAAALVVAIYGVILTKAANAAQQRAVSAQLDPILRARWVTDVDPKPGPISQHFADAVLLIENVGAGTAYQLRVDLRGAWGSPADARTGFQDTYAQRVGPPGEYVHVTWFDHLGGHHDDQIPVPVMEGNFEFVAVLPK